LTAKPALLICYSLFRESLTLIQLHVMLRFLFPERIQEIFPDTLKENNPRSSTSQDRWRHHLSSPVSLAKTEYIMVYIKFLSLPASYPYTSQLNPLTTVLSSSPGRTHPCARRPVQKSIILSHYVAGNYAIICPPVIKLKNLTKRPNSQLIFHIEARLIIQTPFLINTRQKSTIVNSQSRGKSVQRIEFRGSALPRPFCHRYCFPMFQKKGNFLSLTELRICVKTWPSEFGISAAYNGRPSLRIAWLFVRIYMPYNIVW
jgi:hypothetical protein